MFEFDDDGSISAQDVLTDQREATDREERNGVTTVYNLLDSTVHHTGLYCTG